MDTPEPSFRISTPKIFMQVAAPFSLVPARVMSNGQDLVGVPGPGFGLEAGDGVETLAAEAVDGGAHGNAVEAGEARLEDRVLGEKHVLVGLELGRDVIDVGDERTAELADQGEQSLEVDAAQRVRRNGSRTLWCT